VDRAVLRLRFDEQPTVGDFARGRRTAILCSSSIGCASWVPVCAANLSCGALLDAGAPRAPRARALVSAMRHSSHASRIRNAAAVVRRAARSRRPRLRLRQYHPCGICTDCASLGPVCVGKLGKPCWPRKLSKPFVRGPLCQRFGVELRAAERRWLGWPRALHMLCKTMLYGPLLGEVAISGRRRSLRAGSAGSSAGQRADFAVRHLEWAVQVRPTTPLRTQLEAGSGHSRQVGKQPKCRIAGRLATALAVWVRLARSMRCCGVLCPLMTRNVNATMSTRPPSGTRCCRAQQMYTSCWLHQRCGCGLVSRPRLVPTQLRCPSRPVQGASAHRELDQGAAVLHFLLAALKIRMWAEYIPSKANWADEPSRHFEGSPWLKRRGFQVSQGRTLAWPYEHDLADIPGLIQAAIESGVGIGAALGKIPPPPRCSSHRAPIPPSSPARVS
jgi:hypothetical protein